MMHSIRLLCAGGLLLLPGWLLAQSAVVPKTNPMKVYVHMMPWFQTPETLGTNNWGYHWKFNTRNPNIIDANGQREIASNYYPLTGPYDSTDPNIIEYQMLLMKLSGIDGVIVDWYGQKGTNGDVSSLLTASNDIVNSTSTYGLQFAAMLEDRFAGSTSDVSTNITYLRNHYFNQPNYIRTGASNEPLMPIFGPITYTQPSQWNTILAASPGEKIDAVPLWYQSQQLGSNAGGEFSWIYEDAGTNDHLSQQQNFLTIKSPSLKQANSAATVMGVAYPGFNDYYAQGGTGTVIPFDPIPSNNGQTLASVLAVDAADASDMNMLQLATWNDYGEGTQFEPTVQNGFTYLMQVQKFTGVSYGLSQLEMVYQLFEERTAYAGNSSVQAVLNQASGDINQLDFTDAAAALNQYQTITWNGNGSTNHWSSGNWSASTVVATNSLVFSGTKSLSSTNDLAYQTQFNGITFAGGAGAFVLSGNPINLYGDIINNSASLQTISLPMSMQINANINTASGDIAISGILSDGLYGPSTVTKIGAHTLTLSGTNTYSGGTTIGAGTLAVANVAALGTGAVTVNTGGTLQFAANLRGTTVLSGLTVLTGGSADLARTDLLIEYTGTNPYAATLASMQSAYDHARWDQPGIRSSSITPGTTLAIYDNSINTQPKLDGITVPASTVFIKFTWLGDANADGLVNATDLAMMQTTGTEWQQGDFNYDGQVNADDYAMFDLGLAMSGGSNISTVLPEPVGAAAIAIAILFSNRKQLR